MVLTLFLFPFFLFCFVFFFLSFRFFFFFLDFLGLKKKKKKRQTISEKIKYFYRDCLTLAQTERDRIAYMVNAVTDDLDVHVHATAEDVNKFWREQFGGKSSVKTKVVNIILSSYTFCCLKKERFEFIITFVVYIYAVLKDTNENFTHRLFPYLPKKHNFVVY